MIDVGVMFVFAFLGFPPISPCGDKKCSVVFLSNGGGVGVASIEVLESVFGFVENKVFNTKDGITFTEFLDESLGFFEASSVTVSDLCGSFTNVVPVCVHMNCA